MKKYAGIVLLTLFIAPCLMADTEDTTVFRVRMLPDNEVPAITLPGASADGIFTVRVTRDVRGNINAATAIFDVTYTMPSSTTFTGLHIHNAPAGVNGSVVINSGLSGTNNVVGISGNITRVTNYTSADTNGLKYVTGVLATPELYYMNIHTTVYGGGIMRGQLQRSKLSLRPYMSPANEVPAITGLDAEGAALVVIQVERDAAGNANSGSVTFDVAYRFPGNVTITGLHLHKAAAGANGSVVIDSGISSTTTITDPDGRGNIFRVTEVTTSAGLETLTSLLADPTQFYINLHTTVNPGGAVRGQLEKDVLNFMSLMTGAEEVPFNPTTGTSNSLITLRATRDVSGNITGGTTTFDLDYNFPGAHTFTGLHIHNQKIGVNGSVFINTGLSGTSPVVDEDGVGNITREVTISGANALAAFTGLFENPDLFYVNIHTSIFPGGIIRAQLGYETYHFRPILSPSNEVPAITSTATGTGWITIRIKRDANGAIASGTVNFDVNHDIGQGDTITGLHIHRGIAGQNGPVELDSGVTSIVSDTGTGNISRSVEITSASGLTALADLIKNPGGFYLNLHTATFAGGLMRSQLLPIVTIVPQMAGGEDWISSLTITNPSGTAGVHGLVNFFDSKSNPASEAIIDPTMSFWIPPSGRVTFNTHNKGTLQSGSARIHTSGVVTADAGYQYPGRTSTGRVSAVTARSVSVPVNVANAGNTNTGIAILKLTAGNVILTLRDSNGAVIAGGEGGVAMSVGDHIVKFVTELLPNVTASQYTGTLTVQMFQGPFPGGMIAVAALQFDTGTLTAVPVAIAP
jgi:hypothetical protein